MDQISERSHVWQATIPTPGIHFFRLRAGLGSGHEVPGAIGPDPDDPLLRAADPAHKMYLEAPHWHHRAGIPGPWLRFPNISAYVRTDELRSVCEVARQTIDRVTAGPPHVQATLPAVHPPDRLRHRHRHRHDERLLILDPTADIVCLQLRRTLDLSTTAITTAPLSSLVMSAQFPALRNLRRLALHLPDPIGMASERDGRRAGLVLTPRDASALWAPAHFPCLETVYLLSFGLAPRPGAAVPAAAARFRCGDGQTCVEVRPQDAPLWEGSVEFALGRAWLYARAQMTPQKAACWARGAAGESPPCGGLPGFWTSAEPRVAGTEFKVLACVGEVVDGARSTVYPLLP
ncbi:hypothetical protein P8C59_005804 [Phyllachora maydis]|uniref:Uncharacterized protein n=1 Tax=Phyllachora maydis TaxID=1825666 RepID=A0AAD9I6D1_9PEZI|nr:hypothetical protein P8C59_005804 [Phyllachora maydis]